MIRPETAALLILGGVAYFFVSVMVYVSIDPYKPSPRITWLFMPPIILCGLFLFVLDRTFTFLFSTRDR